MTQQELRDLVDRLIAVWENEVVEFKRAGDGFNTNDIGRYFSALSNEANLREISAGWLVFGVDNKTRSVVGTEFRPEPERLHSLKKQIADGTEPSITFRDIYELNHPDGRVILMEIPPAPRGIPISWSGHYYGRAGESLLALGVDKQDTIRQQTILQDWTAQVVAGATFDDLDPDAVVAARESFALKYAGRFAADEVERWTVAEFTERARLTQAGQITRTTLLLLGKAESAWRLNPHPAQLTWVLEGEERAYEHFRLPFLLATTRLYQRIRNVQIRLLPPGELLPVEVSKYDQRTVLEALHNCIAHQDYARGGRIVVTERIDRLIFENEGAFYEGQPDEYVTGSKRPRRYRNPFLTQAMVELNMIDTIGSGIHHMHSQQAKRYLPLPDYDLTEPNAVRLTIHGGVVDLAYSQLLMQRTDLPLIDILALDRVQKRLPISPDATQRLRKAGLIEGRRPNLHVAAVVAAAAGTKAAYIRTRNQDDAHYMKLVTDFLDRFGHATRKDIDALLWGKLSEALSDPQKDDKISNLLTRMRRDGLIQNAGSRGLPSWIRPR